MSTLTLPTKSYARNYQNWLVNNQNTSSFLADNYTPIFGVTNTQIKDTRFTAGMLNYVFFSNPLAFGIYNKIQGLIKTREYGFYGKNENINKELKRLLQASGFDKRLENGILPAMFGTGGGNGLYYTVKKSNGNPEIRFEPFIQANYIRVAVTGDNVGYNEPTKYEVLTPVTQRPLHEFKPEDVYHLKFSSPNGDALIGTGPIISLAKLWLVKLRGLEASGNVFTNGLQAAYVIGLDAGAMSKAPGGIRINDLKDIKKQMVEELKQGTGLENRNRSLISMMPLTFNKLQMTNVEMETLKLIDLTNQETFAAYGIDPAVMDISKSKYDNADLSNDTLYKAIEPIIHQIIKAEMEYVMPRLYPGYNPDKYPFRLAYEPTTEDMAIKEIKQKDLQIWLENYIKAVQAGMKVNPTPEKVEELKAHGFDLTGLEINSSSDDTEDSPIANGFTKTTKAEEFARADDKFTDSATGLQDFTKKVESNPKMQKARASLENKFLKLIQDAK